MNTLEQNDSLQQELKNLARIEEEQKQILKEMNTTQKTEAINTQYSSVTNNSNNTQSSANTGTTPLNYNQSSTLVPYGTTPSFEPYKLDYTPQYVQQQSASYFKSPIMNPFGQQATAAESYYKQVQNGSNRLKVMDILSPGSNTSVQNRELMSMEYGGRIGTSAIAATGAAASFGTNWILGGMLPGMAGIGVSMLGGALVGAYTGMAVDEAKQNNALAKYIYKTSGRYISASESTNERKLGGFTKDQSYDAANFVRKMNDDFYMDDDDISTLLQEFTEGGMLRDVKDIQSFKERMTALTKTVKEGAILLDETYESIAELLSDMKKMGIDSKNYEDFMGVNVILGGETGENPSDTIRDFMDYLKNAYTGTDYNVNDGLTRLQNTAIYVSKYYDELEQNGQKTPLEESNYNYIKNLGGPTQAAMQFDNVMNEVVKSDEFENPALMFFDYNTDVKDFVFNKDKYNDFMDGRYTLQEIYNDSSAKLQTLADSGNAEAISRWKDNAHSYIKNNLTGDMQIDLVQKTLETYASDPSLIAKGFDERTILSMFGVSDSATQNFIAGTLGFKDENPALVSEVNLQNMWQINTAKNIAETPSLTELGKAMFEKGKDKVTQFAVDLNEQGGKFVQWIGDKITGYDRRISPRYDQTFVTRSEKLDSISYEDVKSASGEVGLEIASTKHYLEQLQGKGYKIDDNLMDYVGKKYNVHADDTVQYKRDIIADWDTVDQFTKENKDYITQLAGEKDLSEVIVAALLKYNQQKPDDEKLDLEKLTSTLEAQMVAYGGNEEIALAASMSDDIKTTVDSALGNLGYDMESLRATGMQEVVANVSLESLGLDEKIINQINEMINQNIGGTTTGGENKELNGKKIEEIDFKNMDLSAPSGLTVEQIQQVIDEKTKDKPDSILRQEGVAQAFYDAEQEHNVNAAFLLALSGQEGTWGASDIAKLKNNPFGWGAKDENPRGLASEWSSPVEGIKEFAKEVSENYINSEDHGQNTLQKMMQGSSTATWHRYNSSQSWVDGGASIMKDIYMNVGELTFGQETVQSVGTEKEEIIKDKDGNTLTKEQVKELNAKSGFGEKTEKVQRMEKFVQTSAVIDSPNKYLELDSKESMEEKFKQDYEALKKDQAFGAFKELGFGINFDQTDHRIAPFFDDSMMALAKMYAERYDPTKSMEEILSQDEEIKKQYDASMLFFNKDKTGVGKEYVEQMLKEVTVEKELQTKDVGYEKLQAWGKAYLDFGIEDVDMDVNAYNKALYSEATQWYSENVSNLTDYLVGNKNAEGYKKWDGMSVEEKNSTYEALKALEDAVGANDDNMLMKITDIESIDNFSKEKIYSQKDAENLKYLHKTEDGKYYYDYTDDTGKSTWQDYEMASKQGVDIQKYGAIEKDILSTLGVDVSGGLTSTQLMNTIFGQKDSIMKENAESWEQARDAGMRLLYGKDKITGLSDEQTVAVANMVADADTEGLTAFKERAKSEGIAFDEASLDAFIKLTEAINDTDLSALNTLVESVQEIVNMGKDVGNTVMVMQGTMEEAFDGKAVSTILGNVSKIFDKDSDVMQVVGGKKDDEALKVITDLLINGGIDTTSGVEISQASLEALTAAVSEGMTESVKGIFESEDTIKALKQSQLYEQVAANGEDMYIGGIKMSMDTAVTMIEDLSKEIGNMTKNQEGYDEKIKQKTELVEAVTEHYLESIDSLSKDISDGDETLTSSQDTVKKTTDLFSSTFEKYDGAIKGAITKMNTTISELQGKQTLMDVKLTSLTPSFTPAQDYVMNMTAPKPRS